MTDNQRHIVGFYEELSSDNPIEESAIETLRQFVKLLFAQRELRGSFFFTSHATLCISRGATHAEGSGKPLLTVAPGGKDNLILGLRVELHHDGSGASYAYRSVTYNCGCSSDRALAEFDHLYGKFLDEHGRSSGAGGRA